MSHEIVQGVDAVVSFESRRCIHSRQCVLDRPDVFVPNAEGAWIHPDRATPAELLELAHNCPSGAIQCEAADGTLMEAAPRVNVVRLRENGPLAFRAPIAMNGAFQGYRLTLCRCGASANKPYCDGSHGSSGFSASGETAVVESQALALRDGEIAVKPIPDGPLHVTGNLEVVTGTGRTVARGTECWLCRCGHSLNKPYCDGSHRKVDFRSDS
jgi:CDGSH-type Zn-finger protein/uncharacterized Fe-S cluster protein YjdI